MQLMINDMPQQFAQPLSIADLLQTLAQPQNGIAVALNQQVVSKSQWPHTQLKDHDRITLFKVVAGG
ncbi:sulfur carrier protein ThiS [Bowmanella denitrificans]|uniref:Sulfur carrier protein ThiS n=1 Tax=Bowmanella denitrificans TaxID=366582 RepID=A0ABN0X7J8_9ALTE|nr:sulfur carrier protein ThiS [Bowmanella denitrificans]